MFRADHGSDRAARTIRTDEIAALHFRSFHRFDQFEGRHNASVVLLRCDEAGIEADLHARQAHRVGTQYLFQNVLRKPTEPIRNTSRFFAGEQFSPFSIFVSCGPFMRVAKTMFDG